MERRRRRRGTAVLLSFLAGAAACAPDPEPSGSDDFAELVRSAAGGGGETNAGPGRWRSERADSTADTPADELERLESIGYARGSSEAPSRSGVTVHREVRVQPGSNFYVSGHAPAATLVDAAGREIHRWRLDFESAWPGRADGRDWESASYWRRARLLPDGSVIAIFEGLGIVKVDARSNRLWAVANGAHHDLELTTDHEILVLTRKARFDDRNGEPTPILEDFLTTLDANGRELRRVSVLECLARSEIEDVKRQIAASSGDLLHTNSVRILEGELADRLPAFAAGSVLVSFRSLDVIAVIDPARGLATWAGRGRFHRQHDPRVTSAGRVLLFDNGRRRSRALELDPVTMRVDWKYEGTRDRPFFSATCGTVARLANGNTLITESDRGRAFEVAADGEIVWEFVSPHRAGERNELIATLFDLIRIPPDFPTDWLEDAP